MVTNYGAWGAGAWWNPESWTYYLPGAFLSRAIVREAGYAPVPPQANAMPPQTYGPPGFPSGQGWSTFPAPTPGNVPIPPGFDPSGQGSYYPLAPVPGAMSDLDALKHELTVTRDPIRRAQLEKEIRAYEMRWVAPVGIGTGILLLGLIVLGLTAGRRRRRVY